MEESEKRRDRLKVMRNEASQARASSEIGSAESHQLSNPLTESFANPRVPMNSSGTPRFDYYTDPMSAFSGDKRNKDNNQNSQGYFPTPILRNPEMTSSTAHQVHSTYSPDPRMSQPRSPYYFTSPAYQSQPNYPPDQRMYRAQSPYYSSGPRNPEMTLSPSHQAQSGHYQAQGPYQTPNQHGSPVGRPSSFGVANFSSPGFGATPSSNSGGGRGPWLTNSPNSGTGYGGTSPYLGRGRGRWSGNNTQSGLGRGRNQGLGSHGSVSAELRPDLYYNKTMVEDPWKNLSPSIWKFKTIEVMRWNTPDSQKSLHSNSFGMKKPRISEPLVASSQPSLAEYLAAAFNEAADEEGTKDKASL